MQKNRHQKTETKRLRRCREICTVFFRSEGRLIAGTIRFFDLFSGIGGFREGLQRAGGFTCVGHCEADAYADHNYRVLFDTEGEWFCNDARNIETERMPDFDLLCAGFPCQAFSIAGRREGFADARGTLVFLFPLAGLMYLSGSVTAASYIMYLFMGLAMLIPLETVSNNFDYIGMNASVAKKIDEILKLDEMADTTSKAELSDHTIVFEHVTFSYGEGQPVLKDVSFTVPDGKVTALVGVSGSGKSTAASLICRFWDITEGQICLGGVPLNQIPLSDLMSQISFVTQNTFLFKKSIRENIMMGNPEAMEEEMMQAAKDAVCHDFIMRLPKGYDTVIDKETKLSGGEKQRITLARAILKNAPVVILDEATAYIDADNEDLLQKALAKLSEEKPYS